MKIDAQNAKAYITHCEVLERLSPLQRGGVEIYNELRVLERRAHSITTKMCNGLGNNDTLQNQLDKILSKVCTYFYPTMKESIFINHDARGYAIKFTIIQTNHLIAMGIKPHTDWGGYGILAPDF